MTTEKTEVWVVRMDRDDGQRMYAVDSSATTTTNRLASRFSCARYAWAWIIKQAWPYGSRPVRLRPKPKPVSVEGATVWCRCFGTTRLIARGPTDNIGGHGDLTRCGFAAGDLVTITRTKAAPR